MYQALLQMLSIHNFSSLLQPCSIDACITIFVLQTGSWGSGESQSYVVGAWLGHLSGFKAHPSPFVTLSSFQK